MNITDIIGVSIPVVAIIMGVLLAMVAIYFAHRKNREEQATIRLAMEKGVELPPDLFHRQSDRGCRANPLRRGITWTAVGIALTLALYVNEGLGTAMWGLIPLAVGIGCLIYYKFSPSNGQGRQQG
ncbi:MAG: hypothetical protein A2Z06_04975 [Candidatus Glassbacteria bacterium RBG_16_58_8]|uniref:DUF6249 domain-containing protein n=1 Tax=Candidatus Glassbacteria bacterium RBG_16_58_8 TaxID=1817866 RepID=A0A1F5YBZ5_9BACT|nr:MAG: hypothetical protein A2Z06_04975 [Candidatus Glassbacteria bacterium RBG_16_58_8]